MPIIDSKQISATDNENDPHILNCTIFVAFLSKFVLLRKNLKIKSVFIFLAWIMIFAHGIIPHNHIDADACESQGYVHNHHESNQSPEFRELCKDFESCGLSNVLFQKFSSDDNSLIPENQGTPDLYFNTEVYVIIHDQDIPSGIHPYSVLLRAPPVA